MISQKIIIIIVASVAVLAIGGVAANFVLNSKSTQCKKICVQNGFVSGKEKNIQCGQSEAPLENCCCSGQSSAINKNNCLINNIEDYCKSAKTGQNLAELTTYNGEKACHIQTGTAKLLTDEYFTQVCPEEKGWIVMNFSDTGSGAFNGKKEIQITGKEQKCISISCAPESAYACKLFKSMYGAGCD